MNVAPLNPANHAAALAFVRASPYRNALPLANLTQLRSRCDLVVAEEDGRALGVASTYLDLPLLNLTFVARSAEVTGALLRALAERNPQLRQGPLIALLPAERRALLARHAHILDEEIEYQMAIEPEVLRVPVERPTRRLAPDDAPAMAALAEASGLTVWHSGAFALGPAFGCFVDDRLVAMAATHFATPDIIEIGHIATHPDYRRQGFASACTAALVQAAFTLAPRVFLMVLKHNAPALAAYRRLGFRAIEEFYLTRCLLPAAPE